MLRRCRVRDRADRRRRCAALPLRRSGRRSSQGTASRSTPWTVRSAAAAGMPAASVASQAKVLFMSVLRFSFFRMRNTPLPYSLKSRSPTPVGRLACMPCAVMDDALVLHHRHELEGLELGQVVEQEGVLGGDPGVEVEHRLLGRGGPGGGGEAFEGCAAGGDALVGLLGEGHVGVDVIRALPILAGRAGQLGAAAPEQLVGAVDLLARRAGRWRRRTGGRPAGCRDPGWPPAGSHAGCPPGSGSSGRAP